MKNKNIKLSGIFPAFPNTTSYPYRIYGLCNWNGKRWIKNDKFCKTYGL